MSKMFESWIISNTICQMSSSWDRKVPLTVKQLEIDQLSEEDTKTENKGTCMVMLLWQTSIGIFAASAITPDCSLWPKFDSSTNKCYLRFEYRIIIYDANYTKWSGYYDEDVFDDVTMRLWIDYFI